MFESKEAAVAFRFSVHANKLAQAANIVFDFLGSFFVRQKLQLCVQSITQTENRTKARVVMARESFRANIDVVIVKETYQLHMRLADDCPGNATFSIIEKYFNERLSRAFSNYRLHKGFAAMILTNQSVYLNLGEIIHFDLYP